MVDILMAKNKKLVHVRWEILYGIKTNYGAVVQQE